MTTPRAALTVEAMEGRRVTRLRVRPVAEPSLPARDAAEAGAANGPGPRAPSRRDNGGERAR